MHSAPTGRDSIFGADLRELAAPGGSGWSSGTTTSTACSTSPTSPTLVPDLAERTTFACGPGGLLDALAAHRRARASPTALHRAVPRRERSSPARAARSPSTEAGATVECDGARPILEPAEDAGVLMPSGCRMGICYGCVLPMREGVVRDLRTGELTTAVPARRRRRSIQTCINAAAGACHLDH